MKNYMLVLGIFFSLFACTVEDIDTDAPKENLMIADATLEVDGCKITTFDYGEAGKIEVRHDNDNLHISVFAKGDFFLRENYLHIANTYSDFPTVGKGNLQINKMDHQRMFGIGIYETEYVFPVSGFPEDIVIATYSVFQNELITINAWAGEIPIRTGNWLYFEYTIDPHPINAGTDQSRTITVSEATALPSWDEVRKVYAGMLDPGVDNKTGTYSPTIWELINEFNDPNRSTKAGEFTTVYTLGKGECTDSVILTLHVVPDAL